MGIDLPISCIFSRGRATDEMLALIKRPTTGCSKLLFRWEICTFNSSYASTKGFVGGIFGLVFIIVGLVCTVLGFHRIGPNDTFDSGLIKVAGTIGCIGIALVAYAILNLTVEVIKPEPALCELPEETHINL